VADDGHVDVVDAAAGVGDRLVGEPHAEREVLHDMLPTSSRSPVTRLVERRSHR
jgi:hypothetical protein